MNQQQKEDINKIINANIKAIKDLGLKITQKEDYDNVARSTMKMIKSRGLPEDCLDYIMNGICKEFSLESAPETNTFETFQPRPKIYTNENYKELLHNMLSDVVCALISEPGAVGIEGTMLLYAKNKSIYPINYMEGILNQEDNPLLDWLSSYFPTNSNTNVGGWTNIELIDGWFITCLDSFAEVIQEIKDTYDVKNIIKYFSKIVYKEIPCPNNDPEAARKSNAISKLLGRKEPPLDPYSSIKLTEHLDIFFRVIKDKEKENDFDYIKNAAIYTVRKDTPVEDLTEAEKIRFVKIIEEYYTPEV